MNGEILAVPFALAGLWAVVAALDEARDAECSSSVSWPALLGASAPW